MQYIVMYDISEDKQRNKALEICRYFGMERIQYSVYGGRLEKKARKEIEKELKMIKIGSEDSIGIVTICNNCLIKSTTIGKKKTWEKKTITII